MKDELFDVIVHDHRDSTYLKAVTKDDAGFNREEAADLLMEICDDAATVMTVENVETKTVFLWSVCAEQKQHYSFFAAPIHEDED